MKKENNRVASLILAAGKSTRMQKPNFAKVCIPVNGVPVIIRGLRTYKKIGVSKHIIIVGHYAESVMRTIADEAIENVFYAFQNQALGTGHAAKMAVPLLNELKDVGAVLVVVGDRVLRPTAIQKLMDVFESQKADLAFLTGNIKTEPTSGRIILSDSGEPVANIEKFDSAKSLLLEEYFRLVGDGGSISAQDALHLAKELIGPEKKIALALGGLFDALQSGQELNEALLKRFFSPHDRLITLPNGDRISGETVEQTQQINLSVYLFKKEAFLYAVQRLSNDNAQKEEYLTDTIGILAATGEHKLAAIPVAHEDTMAFNTPKELEQLEKTWQEENI